MIYLVIGRRELGKTTLAYRMLKALPKRAVIDARQMIVQHDARVETQHTMNEASDALYAMIDGESDEVIYQPHEEDLPLVFDAWTRTLKRIAIETTGRHVVGVLVDEASFYNLESKPFQWLAKCAKRDDMHILITAHQPKDIPTSIRAIADHWFIFYTTQETDLDKIAEKSPDAAREARKLRDRAYVHWDDTKARLSVQTHASSWYVPLEVQRPRAEEQERVEP